MMLTEPKQRIIRILKTTNYASLLTDLALGIGVILLQPQQ